VDKCHPFVCLGYAAEVGHVGDRVVTGDAHTGTQQHLKNVFWDTLPKLCVHLYKILSENKMFL